MRESYGGVFMIMLLLVILFVVVGFTAMGISIGKSFRVKNKIISYIEQYEGCVINGQNPNVEETFDKGSSCTGEVATLIDDYMSSVGYNNGYRVAKRKATDKDGFYYTVTVYIDINIPLVMQRFIEISGKTYLIEKW